MTKGIRAIVAVALVCAGSASAVAGEGKRLKAQDGVIVTQHKSGVYCIRTSSEQQAERLGLDLHATACKSRMNWAREGLTLMRKAPEASQVASVD